jgi:hypothetical protein
VILAGLDTSAQRMCIHKVARVPPAWHTLHCLPVMGSLCTLTTPGSFRPTSHMHYPVVIEPQSDAC